MKTTLMRYDVHMFERLVSKLFRPSDLPQTVSFVSCTDGLQFIAYGGEAVLSMTIPTEEAVEPFTLPWAAIKELASKKHDNVELNVEGNNVSVTYLIGGVPQHRSFPSLGLTDKRLPNMPDNTVAHSLSLLDALTDAGKCVDPENSKYSLGAVCLRGSKAQIASTDGRQALIQDGFAFHSENDVLCPVSKIFASRELREFADTVRVGFEDDWIYFQIGTVKLWLKQIEGKFPQLEQFTKNTGHFTWLNVDPSDGGFTAQRLDNLPGKTDRESPVYVELNGHVAVRSHDRIQRTATELRLTRSRYDGKPLTMPVNRRFLKNALVLGIHRLGFDPDERTPLVGYGDRKTFVIMPLEGDEPKVETNRLTVLKSDTKAVPEKSPKAVKTQPAAPSVAVAARRIKETAKPKGKAMILDDAVKLRQNLWDTLGSVNDLIRSIKSQRRQDKLLRDTVASLRKLQNV